MFTNNIWSYLLWSPVICADVAALKIIVGIQSLTGHMLKTEKKYYEGLSGRVKRGGLITHSLFYFVKCIYFYPPVDW